MPPCWCTHKRNVLLLKQLHNLFFMILNPLGPLTPSHTHTLTLTPLSHTHTRIWSNTLQAVVDPTRAVVKSTTSWNLVEQTVPRFISVHYYSTLFQKTIKKPLVQLQLTHRDKRRTIYVISKKTLQHIDVMLPCQMVLRNPLGMESLSDYKSTM